MSSLLATLTAPAKLLKNPPKPKTRDARKAEVEAILNGDSRIAQEVGAAQAAREEQDRFVARIEDSPLELAAMGEQAFDLAHRDRVAKRMTLGRALLRQQEYREEHDIAALRAEFVQICDEEKHEAQQAHLRKVGDAALKVLAAMRHASEVYRSYCGLFDDAAKYWPNDVEGLLRSYPLLPPGALSPNGLRSIEGYFSDALMLADSGLLPDGDPARARVESAKAAGREFRLFLPTVTWGE